MNHPFKPLASLEKLLHYWWLLILFALCGAVTGWMLHFFFSPVYEATASFSVNIDFTRTGELTDVEEDMAIVAVGDIIKSSAVMNAAAARAEQSRLLLEGEVFSDLVYLERENDRWLLIARTTDPSQAVELSNVWAEEADIAIQSAYKHALSVEQLERYLDGLAGCLQQLELSEPAVALCSISDLNELQKELENTSSIYQQEKIAAMGLMPASQVYLSSQAEMPYHAVIFVTEELVFAGMVMGFIIGLLVIESGSVNRLPLLWKRKRK